MSEFKCPFCGATELRTARVTQFGPETELKENGQYGPVMEYCCAAQRKNAQYISKNFHPDDAPDPSDISKW